MVIDGRLDEEDWSAAPVGRPFVERVPRPGALPPVATEVRVLHDRDAIYVAVTSYLEEGEVPRALELTRDSSRIWSDDAITLKFDVRHDRRSTVGFAVNPAGAQIDFLALDNGNVFRLEYDAVWEAAARTEGDRWTAEFRIPAAALGLPPGFDGRLLGFNVTRDHNARQATYDWSHLPPEFGAMSALHYGDLAGAEDVGGGTPFVLNPYALLEVPGRPAWDIPFELRAGGEARLRLAGDTWGELTLVTDFAEVDNDAQIVNLDRFPLFLPERRPFFLNGLDVFAFGSEGQAQLFFTRRIGLDEAANPVPILGGLKVYGRQDPVRFGVLNVVTAATDGQPAANWGVARMRVNVGEASYLGAMIASRAFLPDDLFAPGPSYAAEPHLSVGLDGLVRAFDRRLEASAFAAFTYRDGPQGSEGLAGEAVVRWRGEQWMPVASVLYLQEGLRPELGFVRRPSIVRGAADVPWVARNVAPGLRTLTLTGNGRLELEEDLSRVLRASGGYLVDVETEGRWRVFAGSDYVEDVVRQPFDLLPDLEVAAGTYRGVATILGARSPSERNPEASVTLRVSNAFFGGVSYQADVDGAAAFGRHLRMSVGAVGTLLDFPERSLTPTLALNATVTVTPNALVVLDLVGQVNSVGEVFLGLARLRWRYLPGSDLFVVYRTTWSFVTRSVDQTVTVKVAYRADVLL